MSDNDKATPRPWRVYSLADAHVIVSTTLSTEDLLLLGYEDDEELGHFHDKANADFVARATNAHEDLVGALNEARGELRVFWDAQGYRDEYPDLDALITSALTKARGETPECGVPASATAVTREVLPRCERGIDYGAERIVLARAPDGRMLIWLKAHKAWKNRLAGFVSMPGSLQLVHPLHHASDAPRSTILYQEGGRLSVALVHRFRAQIDEFFGYPGLTDGLNTTTTVIVNQGHR